MAKAATAEPKSETRRIQFEFSPEAYERLQQIKAETGAQSYAELVRNALRLYEWVIQQERDGYKIGVTKENKLVREVEFLF